MISRRPGFPKMRIVLTEAEVNGVRIHNREQGIQCLGCGLSSWNPNDLSNVYCGNCDAFGSLLENEKSPGAHRRDDDAAGAGL
jgi:hypothetical protein